MKFSELLGWTNSLTIMMRFPCQNEFNIMQISSIYSHFYFLQTIDPYIFQLSLHLQLFQRFFPFLFMKSPMPFNVFVLHLLLVGMLSLLNFSPLPFPYWDLGSQTSSIYIGVEMNSLSVGLKAICILSSRNALGQILPIIGLLQFAQCFRRFLCT